MSVFRQGADSRILGVQIPPCPIRLVKHHQKVPTFVFTAPAGESGLQRTYESDVKMSPYLAVHIYVLVRRGLFETGDLLCRRLLLPHHLLLPQRGLQLLDVAADHLVPAPHLRLKK